MNQSPQNPQQQEYLNSTTAPKKQQDNKQLSTQSHLQFSEIKDGIAFFISKLK